ncbi:crooked neck protein [Perilla frutescens var. hirtella]|nr:crooked neck protein [Perilla frutescens var. hirtella]
MDISSDDEEAVKKAEQPTSATTPTGHTKPQILWKAVHESGLPDKRECLHRARAVFERALSHFRTSAPELKEERTMLLEEWFHMENSFGELGDVDLVRAKLPRKLKKRRLIEAEDAPTTCSCDLYEEYVEHIFPEETPRAKNAQILEAAYKWKNDTNKMMKVYYQRARSQQHGSWPDLPFTLSKKHRIAVEDD